MVREVAPPKAGLQAIQASTASPQISPERSPTSPTSPTRRPLHERSKSQSNLSSPPRLVPNTQQRPPTSGHYQPFNYGYDDNFLEAFPSKPDDPAAVYGRSPFPSEPAHILQPGLPNEAGSSSPWQGSRIVISPLDVSKDSRSTVTVPLRPTTPSTSPNNTSLTPSSSRGLLQSPASPANTDNAARTPTSPASPRSSIAPKRIKHVTVHPDKTFSVLDVLRSAQDSASEDRLRSQNRSLPSLKTTSSHDRLSSDASLLRRSPFTAVSLAQSREHSVSTPVLQSESLSKPALSFPTSSVPQKSPAGEPRAAWTSPIAREKGTPSSSTESLNNHTHNLSERASLASFASTAATEHTVTAETHKIYPASPPSRSETTLVLDHERDSADEQDSEEDIQSSTPIAAESEQNYHILGHTSSLEGSPNSQPSVIHRPASPSLPRAHIAGSSEPVSEEHSPAESSIEENYTVLGRSSPPPARRSPSESSIPLVHINSSPPEPSSPAEDNYEILGRTSPVIEPSSPGEPNYVVLGRTSPVLAPSSSEPNYTILGRTSPVLEPSSPGNPNYEILGRTSPVQEPSSPSESNYEILGRTSPVAPSSPPQSNYQVLEHSASEQTLPNYQVLQHSSSVPNYQVLSHSSSTQTLPKLPSNNSLRRLNTEHSLPDPSSDYSLQPFPTAESLSRRSSLHKSSRGSLQRGVFGIETIPEDPTAQVTSDLTFRDFDSVSEDTNEQDSPVREDQETSLVRPSQPKQKYSQESLIIPPLRTKAKRSTERFPFKPARSRESLRAGSLSSITTVLSQEAIRAIVTGGSTSNLRPVAASSSWAEPGSSQLRLPMQTSPHQWSSQLSTVPSESEHSEETRTWSRSARLSSPVSRHSRQVLSISSSLRQELEDQSIEELERPSPAYMRRQATQSSLRIVDQDEHGDGLTDLQELRNRPSRNRLYNSFFNTSDSRTNSMMSIASSRANSMVASSFPAWARLYYGSGERPPLLSSPSMSTLGGDSRHPSMVGNSGYSYSPQSGSYADIINNPRRRPRDAGQDADEVGMMSDQQLVGTDDGASPGIRRLIHRFSSRNLRTPSLWSPHLGTDRRAGRVSIWEAPSLTWSTEGRWTGRRNIQVVMFIVGFIFPFAWITGAFLPLPEIPEPPMQERTGSQIDAETTIEEYMSRQTYVVEEHRYESAKWWRTLNRVMAVGGVAIIATIIILVVIGVDMGL